MPDSPSYQALINGINEASAATLPRPLTADDCVFGDPKPYGGDAANTMIPFGTTAPNLFGQGPMMITYNRIVLDTLQPPADPINSTGATNVSDLLDAINSAYGITLGDNDIVDCPLVRNEDGTVTAYLLAAPQALYYTGSILLSLADTATPPDDGTDLSEAVTNTDLDGLTPPGE